jgi:predicted DNA-binding transcriptional regulator AlpA
MDGAPALLNISEVCERVGLNRTTFYQLMKKGKAPRPVVLGLRSVMWDPSLIDQFIASRGTEVLVDWRGRASVVGARVPRAGPKARSVA